MRKTKQKSLSEKLLYMEGFVYVKENQKFVFFSHLEFFSPSTAKKKVFVRKYTHRNILWNLFIIWSLLKWYSPEDVLRAIKREKVFFSAETEV